MVFASLIFPLFNRPTAKPTKHNLANASGVEKISLPLFDEVEIIQGTKTTRVGEKEKKEEKKREKKPMRLSSSSTSISLFSFRLIFDAPYGGERRKNREKRKTKFRQSAEYINININGLARAEKGEKEVRVNNFDQLCC